MQEKDANGRMADENMSTATSLPDHWTKDELDRKRRLEAGETLAISMSQAKDAAHKNLLEWATSTGRLVRADTKTKWGNPYNKTFRSREITREEAVDFYERDLSPELREAAAKELSGGKALGCWCAPKRCHCDVLAEIANSTVDTCVDVSTGSENGRVNLFEKGMPELDYEYIEEE